MWEIVIDWYPFAVTHLSEHVLFAILIQNIKALWAIHRTNTVLKSLNGTFLLERCGFVSANTRFGWLMPYGHWFTSYKDKPENVSH